MKRNVSFVITTGFLNFKNFELNTLNALFWNNDTHVLFNETSYTSYNDSITFDYILDTETQTDWKLINREFDDYNQYLLIPSNNAQIDVNSKQTLLLNLYCHENSSLFDSYLYYTIDNRQQLYDYNNFGSAMQDFFWASDYIYSGYDIKLYILFYTSIHCVSVYVCLV